MFFFISFKLSHQRMVIFSMPVITLITEILSFPLCCCSVTQSHLTLCDPPGLQHWRRQWHPTPVFLPGKPHCGGAPWAAVHGVEQSRTQLKGFNSNSNSNRTAACQTSLSFTFSQSLLKLMSIELVMPSNHLILCRPLLPPSIFPSIRVFSNESGLCIRWPKY